MSAEGNLRSRIQADRGEVARSASLQVRFAPVAWLVGAGFAGYGVAGFLGAGVALMLPATAVFVGALLDLVGSASLPKRPKARKTLRHRYCLWLDQQYRKVELRKKGRRERKEAERDFLERRSRRGR